MLQPPALPDYAGVPSYSRMFARHKWLIVGVSLGFGLAGLGIARLQRPVYRAHTSLEIQSPNESFMDIKALDPAASIGVQSSQAYIETQARKLRDEGLIERVTQQVDLGRRWNARDSQDVLGRWLRRLKPQRGPASERVAVKNLTVNTSSDSHIVDVFFDSPDPNLSADFTNTLTRLFIDQEIEARWGGARRLAEWLNRELERVKRDLEQSDRQLQANARSTGLMFNQDKGTTVAEDRLRELQEELARAQADRIVKQSRYEIAASSSPQQLPEVLDNPTLRDHQVRLSELQRQAAESNVAFTAKFPKMASLQAQIAQMESTIRTERGDILGRISNEYQAAVRREQMVRQSYEQQAKLVRDQAAGAVQYNVRKRDVDTNRTLYEALLQKTKEAALVSAIRVSNLRIISPAKPPDHPYKPNAPLSTSMGLIAGLFLSVAYVFLREHTDRTLRCPGDTTAFLNVPDLGTVPTAAVDRLVAGAGRDGRVIDLRPEGPDGRILPGPNLHNRGRSQVQLSIAAESFQAVLVSLMLRAGSQPSLFVVTSAGVGEGKTTLVSNLGVTLANSKRKVLLVDADLLKPRLHLLFGLTNARGLGNILTDRDPVSCSSDALILKTHVPGLSLLPAGSVPVNIASMWYDDRLADLLRFLRSRFDAVLVDTPPVLELADARVLAHLSDGVVLVVRAARTTLDEAAAVVRRFQEDGTPILGAILNACNPKDSPRGNYTYRNYGGYRNLGAERYDEQQTGNA